MKKVFIKTFGCAQNVADSERIKAFYWEKGYTEVDNWQEADEVVINTCIVRESAENRAWGLINVISNFQFLISKRKKPKIIVTGCVVGAYGKKDIKGVDEWANINKFLVWEPIRQNKKAALISISTGCNNMCSYCIVPKARGKEISRLMEDILIEANHAIKNGFNSVVLIGQNVNSYGSDLNPSKSPLDRGDCIVHMGKRRLQSAFPELLENVAKMAFEKISFVSSNPWDFSDELINIIAKYKNIDRLLHLPFQSGNDEILRKMNRSYTKKEYLDLVAKIKSKVEGVKFSTDIIIGFPGENDEAFEDTVDVCKQVGFDIAYINKYSPRVGTVSAKIYPNDISMKEKKKRWVILDDLVNKKLS